MSRRKHTIFNASFTQICAARNDHALQSGCELLPEKRDLLREHIGLSYSNTVMNGKVFKWFSRTGWTVISYIHELENLGDFLEPKGIVVIDDYNFFQGCKKAVDEFLAKQAYQPLLHHIAVGGGRYLIKL